MKQHWSVDESVLVTDPSQFAIWCLEQRINWGIGERKINKNELKHYWDQLDLDPWKRRALALALFA